MKPTWLSFPLFILSLLTVSSADADAKKTQINLGFVADLNLPTGTIFENTDVGGLSAAVFKPETSELFVLSDDRSERQPARITVFKLTLHFAAKQILQLTPIRIITIRQADGSTYPKWAIDPEGLALSPRGGFFISQEGDSKGSKRPIPSVLETDGNGKVIKKINLPSKFLPESASVLNEARSNRQNRSDETPAQGIYSNLGPEGLSLVQGHLESTPLIVGLEGPLKQDDSIADFSKGSLARILCLDPGQLISPREFIYPIDKVLPMSPTPQQENSDGRGISEILAIPRSLAPDFSFDPWMLVLERGSTYVNPEGKWFNQVTVFLTHLSNSFGASAVADFHSLKDGDFTSLSKTKLLDLNLDTASYTPGFQSLDNLEAMAWGPNLPNGDASIIFISDNNFNPAQRTQVLLYSYHVD